MRSLQASRSCYVFSYLHLTHEGEVRLALVVKLACPRLHRRMLRRQPHRRRVSALGGQESLGLASCTCASQRSYTCHCSAWMWTWTSRKEPHDPQVTA